MSHIPYIFDDSCIPVLITRHGPYAKYHGRIAICDICGDNFWRMQLNNMTKCCLKCYPSNGKSGCRQQLRRKYKEQKLLAVQHIIEKLLEFGVEPAQIAKLLNKSVEEISFSSIRAYGDSLAITAG